MTFWDKPLSRGFQIPQDFIKRVGGHPPIHSQAEGSLMKSDFSDCPSKMVPPWKITKLLNIKSNNNWTSGRYIELVFKANQLVAAGGAPLCRPSKSTTKLFKRIEIMETTQESTTVKGSWKV